MNENRTREIVDNPPPEWGLMMFWEDLTAILQKLAEVIASLFRAL